MGRPSKGPHPQSAGTCHRRGGCGGFCLLSRKGWMPATLPSCAPGDPGPREGSPPADWRAWRDCWAAVGRPGPRGGPLSCFRPLFVVREEAGPGRAALGPRLLPIGPRRHVPAISWGQPGLRGLGGCGCSHPARGSPAVPTASCILPLLVGRAVGTLWLVYSALVGRTMNVEDSGSWKTELLQRSVLSRHLLVFCFREGLGR